MGGRKSGEGETSPASTISRNPVLGESAEELRLFMESVENATDAIGISTPEGRHFYQNRAFDALFGEVGEDPPETLYVNPAVGREVFRTIQAGGQWSGEVQMYDRSRRIRTILLQAYASRDRDGRVSALVGVHTDVTDRRQAEAALRKSEAWYRALAEAAPDMIFYFDRDLRVQYVNDLALQTLRCSPEEIRGRCLDEVLPPEFAEPHCSLVRQVLETGERLSTEARWRFAADEFWIEWRLAPVREDAGTILGVIGLARDITLRKRAEERYRATVESAPVGMHFYRLEEDDRLIFVGANPAADRLLGVDNRQFIGKTIEEAFPPLAQTEIPDRYRRAARSGEKWATEQVEYDHQGIRGAFSVLVFQNEPRHAVVMFFDITERKRSEAERERLQAELARSQKLESVGRLAGGIAHDFNNMLSVILYHTEMLIGQAKSDDPLLGELRRVHLAAERSADLMRQLLAFARQQTIAPQVLDLNEAVERLLPMLSRFIGEGIELAWLPETRAGRVRMDPSQVDQILVNLCGNARDAVGTDGKVTIETGWAVFDEAYCAAHPGHQPGEYALLAVSDNGCGMEEATLDRIFEPFFTTKERGKGTGLGLATIYGIVRQNRGFIHVYSEPGRGTTFRVYLPRCNDDELPAPKGIQEALPMGRGETILLVEDEPMVRDLVQLMLTHLGYSVLVATTPEEALCLARDHGGTIDLLLTDVVMPGMNGRELAAGLNEIHAGMRCLFMSGYTANVIAHHGVLDPGIQFLQKPFSRQELAIRVREALASR